MASTAVSTVPNAVITTTGSAAFCRLIAWRNSRPFIPGSLRSVTTRSTVFSRRSFSPASASPADSVLNPSSPRFNSSRRRIFASSSTIKIVGIVVDSCRPLLQPQHSLNFYSLKMPGQQPRRSPEERPQSTPPADRSRQLQREWFHDGRQRSWRQSTVPAPRPFSWWSQRD